MVGAIRTGARSGRARLLRLSPAALIVALYLVVALFTFVDYGISWDEPIQALYAERVISYYASGLEDRSYEQLLNLAYYGPVFEVLPAAVYAWLPEWKYEIRHLFIALFAALGLMGVAQIANRLSDDRRMPAFSVLILILMPAYYGHTFINSKDVPFATLFTWSVWAVLKLFERPDRRNVLLLGTIAGLMFGIRVGGVLLFMIAAAALLAYALKREARTRSLKLLPPLAVSGAVAWLIMIAVWPWAHRDPVGGPLEALRSASSIPMVIEVLFGGRHWPASELPSRFTAEMFAVTTPLPILALVVLGFGLLVRRLIRRQAAFADVLLIAWVLIPPILQIVVGASRYDGTRHFLFVFPALAILGAGGALAIARVIDHPLATAGLVVAIASIIPAMVRLHPYQYTFRHEAVRDRYETDYWATSYKEAAEWIAEHRCADGTSVLMAGDRFLGPALIYFLPEDVDVTVGLQQETAGEVPAQFDYYVGLRRQRLDENYSDTPIAHSIGRLGMTFAVIRGGCANGELPRR
ncbi:MAG TPA: glycosyltransferase family 39 protein [Thermoanaerobaculia bacterium]|nr:glycosyltransferase family 39 protein [Thermoanaerobaculia bacterium]